MKLRRLSVSAGLAVVVLFSAFAAQAAVPKPTCRTTDKTESGLDGQTTLAEVDAGLVANGFNCNTDLVGQYQGEGASWQLAAWKTCAYFDQAKNPAEAHPGTVVLDVTDPTNPTPTAWLSDVAMLDPWESLKVNSPRQLLGGDQGTYGAPGPGFSIYDISTDCAHPAQKSVVNITGSLGHTGQWAPDGKTYYITTIAQTTASLVAVDTTDATAPVGIALYTPPDGISPVFHDLEFSADGKTAYEATIGGGLSFPASENGLIILDVSQVQDRTGTTINVIGTDTWDDGSTVSQNALPITIAGKPYILFTDESGSAGGGTCSTAGNILYSYGVPRLIDISTPSAPVTVSKLDMEVADIANCQASLTVSGASSGAPLFGASCHYCNVDNVDDAKIAACNCFTAGLRIFDISVPTNPREVGYYKPPAQGTKVLPGSQYASGNFTGSPPTYYRPVDWAASKPSFPRDRGDTSGDLWTTSQDNGFQVIHLYTGVTVSPTTASIQTGQSTTLTATVVGIGQYQGVNWTVTETGGSVTSAGVFTSSTAGTYHVNATSGLDGSAVSSAVVTVAAASSSSSGCGVAPSEPWPALAGLALLLYVLRRRRGERTA
jgi:MYXO-CTERM domain-containing protein